MKFTGEREIRRISFSYMQQVYYIGLPTPGDWINRVMITAN